MTQQRAPTPQTSDAPARPTQRVAAAIPDRLKVWGPGSAVAAALAIGLVLDLVADQREAAVALWLVAIVGAIVPLTIETVRALARREAGVDAIALLAMLGAIALGEWVAGVIVALMYLGGEGLESYAASRARRELTALVEGAPQRANRRRGDAIEDIDVDAVSPGDELVVRPGELVPVDGIVLEGQAALDERTLTGESRPVERPPGTRVQSGATNAGSPFTLRATATAQDSTYTGLVRLVEAAQAEQAPFERLADRAAGVFLPITVVVALAAWLLSGDPVNGLAVLVVATPCPMILAAPIAITSGVSRLAGRGVLVKGGGALEALADVDTVLLDKTGTLTAGRPRLVEVITFDGADPDEVLHLAASVDQLSSHVFAASIVDAARTRGIAPTFPDAVESETGSGIAGTLAGRRIRVGRAAWTADDGPLPAEARAVTRRTAVEGTSSVFVAADGRLLGALLLDDPLRPEAARTLRGLRALGVQRFVMVTGDHGDIGELVGEAVGVDRVLAERSPADKVADVRALRSEGRGRLLMVGDGVNDAPALAEADLGVAMGAQGATASSQASDVILVVDRLDRLRETIAVAQRTRRIAWQSVAAGMGMSFVAMGFAAFGFITPVVGAVLQEVIDLAVIANALRALRAKEYGPARPELAERAAGLRAEHGELAAGIDRLRSLADSVDRLEPDTLLAELRSLHTFLSQELLAHELDEERAVFPLLSEAAGDEDPTAPLRHTHREIVRLVRLLGHTLDAIGEGPPDDADRTELRRLLYGLHAIMGLHNAQEEEALGMLDAAEAGGKRDSRS